MHRPAIDAPGKFVIRTACRIERVRIERPHRIERRPLTIESLDPRQIPGHHLAHGQSARAEFAADRRDRALHETIFDASIGHR